MSPVTYQTIKLSKGKHTSPEDGACVMELASMLAGEQFSDHPASVCPVLEWAAEMRQRRWTRFLLPGRLRAVGLHRHPPMDAVGTHAVHAIPRHTDQTHTEVLALVDELLAIGAPAEPLTAPARRPAPARPLDAIV
jgi:hypothetical protein